MNICCHKEIIEVKVSGALIYQRGNTHCFLGQKRVERKWEVVQEPPANQSGPVSQIEVEYTAPMHQRQM